MKIDFMNNRNGITLISLVVTIIILLILVGVGVSLFAGEDGIIDKAQKAKEKYEQNATNETEVLNSYNSIIDYYTKDNT